MRPLLLLLCITMASGVPAQSNWRVDSLMATWPVRQAVEEARHGSHPGVVRAVDTRGLYAQLQRAVPALPVFADSNVAYYANLYGEPEREKFRALLGAAQHYFPLIEGELARQGLSKDLKYLPMALSAMNTLAGSPSGEAGLWMLSYPVALRYGLNVTDERDERRDPRLATMAAARYLKDLYARYDDQGLALMAFMCGPANVTRARGRTGNATDQRTLYPHVTAGHRDVLPLLMAFIHLGAHAQELGIAPIPVRPAEIADTLRSERELRMSAVAATLGIAPSRLRALNPVLCSDRVPAFEAFLLPRGERARFTLLADSVQRTQQRLAEVAVADSATARAEDGRETISYRVRNGDHLGGIAMRFGVKVSQIKAWNKLRSDRISAGDRLVIHLPASQRARYERLHGQDTDESPTNSIAPKAMGATVRTGTSLAGYTWYTVRAGDSLYGIARRYPGVEAKQLMELNGIAADIKPGQKLKIPVQP